MATTPTVFVLTYRNPPIATNPVTERHEWNNTPAERARLTAAEIVAPGRVFATQEAAVAAFEAHVAAHVPGYSPWLGREGSVVTVHTFSRPVSGGCRKVYRGSGRISAVTLEGAN